MSQALEEMQCYVKESTAVVQNIGFLELAGTELCAAVNKGKEEYQCIKT